MDNFKCVIILSILAIIFISGCTIPGTDNVSEQKSKGLNILDFEPDFSEVRSGEPVTLKLRLKNTGTSKVENGFAEVLGLDFTWKGDKGTEVIDNEVLPDEEECKYTKKIMTLLPESQGVEAGEAICTWRYIAPDVQKGIFVEYKPRVRVYYNYYSFVQKSISIVSRNELKMYQDQGKPLPSETTQKSEAPINLDMEIKTPIRVYENMIEFPVVIKIDNIGGGVACLDSASCKKPDPEWNVLNIKIEMPDGLTLKDCEEYDNKEGKVYLVRGKSQTISCKINVRSVPENLVQKNIKITAKYGYFVEKETYIKVIG
jgi:hypothetical protein